MKKLNEQIVMNVMQMLITANGATTTLEVKMMLRDLGYYAEQKDVSKYLAKIEEETMQLRYESNGDYRIYKSVNVNADVPTDHGNDTVWPVDEDGAYDDSIWEDEDEDEDDTNAEIKAADIFDDLINIPNSVNNEMIDEFNQDMKKCMNCTEDTCECAAEVDKFFTDNIQNTINDFNGNIGTATIKNNTKKDLSKPTNIGHYFRKTDVVNSLEAVTDQNTWVVHAKDGLYSNTPYYTFNSDLTSDKVRSRYATMTNTKIQDVRARRVKNVKL